MSKRKAYTIFLSIEDRIDVDLEFEKDRAKPPRLSRFAITYSARIAERWKEVVRYDNFHGYLHRQKFWRVQKPEPLPDLERGRTDLLLKTCRDDLRRNWRRYRSLMESRSRED
jgi:hypothetical protein